MKDRVRLNTLLMALLIIYSLSVMCWGVVMNPLSPGEAMTIFIGRNVLTELGVAEENVPAPSDIMMDTYTGSPAVAPAVIAAADSAAGIYGARLVSVMFCLLLIILLYKTGNTPLYGGRGLLTGATFALLGLPLQLSSSANADACAALFLGASLLCVAHAAGLDHPRKRASIVLAGALSLALAAMVSYTVMFFVLPFVLYVFLLHRPFTAGVFFLLPLLVLLALYGYFAVLPVLPAVENEFASFQSLSGGATNSSGAYIFYLLNMALLLAAIGIFHKEGGIKSIFLLLLAAPAFIVHLECPGVNYMHTAAMFSLVFLAPAAALGVVQLSELFSLYNDMKLAKPFFVTALLVITFVFGIQQIRGLNKERPDLSSAVSFLNGRPNSYSTLLVDSDYGSPEFVYRYYLGKKTPWVRIIPIKRGTEKERRDIVASQRPDYVVVDGFHSVKSFDQVNRDYLAQDFTVAATYSMSLTSGVKNILVFQKGAL